MWGGGGGGGGGGGLTNREYTLILTEHSGTVAKVTSLIFLNLNIGEKIYT